MFLKLNNALNGPTDKKLNTQLNYSMIIFKFKEDYPTVAKAQKT